MASDMFATRRPDDNKRVFTICPPLAGITSMPGWFAAYVAVCAIARIRRGEASALQVGDISFLRKELHVTRQVQWTDGRMEIRAPKYSSERTVFIPDRLLTILSEYIRQYVPGDDPDRWLFPRTMDPTKPVHAATVGRALRTEIGITNRLHDARHFYASGLIASGFDLVTVQRALGHASAAQTLSTYSHLWPEPAIAPGKHRETFWSWPSVQQRTHCGRRPQKYHLISTAAVDRGC
jgi:integrase